MSFICQTPSCAIAISKAEFPAAMNCPVCQTLLSEVVESLSQEDSALIASLPYVIAYPLQQTLLEKHPPQRINLFKDTFLNYLKYLGLLSASEFFNSDIKDKGMVLLFQQNLIETAFGKWNHYIRESLKFLKDHNHPFFCPELVSYYELIETGSKAKKHKGEIEFIDANGDIQLKKQESTSIGMLINFRNRYLGHGLTLDAQKAEALWQEYFPIFRNLLEQLSFANDYPMLKREDGITYLLHSAEISTIDFNNVSQSSIWIQNKKGESFDILPFFIVPGEVSLAKEDKEQMFTYESYTGKTIKFFSPEGTEKQTSGKLLEKLNLLLRDKQKEVPFAPKEFTKEEFLNRIEDENKLLHETLINEKKIIPGVYQHREEMEIKLREWIGARANIFFIAAEAGSGKTNLLAEIQKQYAERELPSLLIRAGRMEKKTLTAQIAYLLNIDLQQGLENYTSLAGTQAEPTFILIDGLNEANHAEAIWQEIMYLSSLFEPGSVKFVVTNRANTKADLERYLVSDKEQELLYGENKENENGLGAYSYWLTSLDMKEMKGAWENYVAKDKARFKPQFTFDAIAEFDRGIYNQINNPLILRLFLEIYNGKTLPKKGNKHLHIWSDWLKTFSEAEQTFFSLLADAVWDCGANELLLDDLLNDKTLKLYFTSDVINAPYQRLKNLGWISSYTKDLNSYVGFTVEGSLLYLLSKKLQSQIPKIDLEYVQSILQTNNKLKMAAIEAFLGEEALTGNLDLVSELIDALDQDISICITPLVLFLRTFGVKATIEKVLANPTENDWKALLKVEEQLKDLQLHILRKEFFTEVMSYNQLLGKKSILLALKSLRVFDIETSKYYYSLVNSKMSLIKDDSLLLTELGHCEEKFGNYENALKHHKKCLKLHLEENQEKEKIIAINYSNIGNIYRLLDDYDNSMIYNKKSLEISLKHFNSDNILIANSYNAIGVTHFFKHKYFDAIEYFQKALEIRIKQNGKFHSDVAASYNNIGSAWNKLKEFDKAINFSEKSLNIRIKNFGNEHLYVAMSYSNIGEIYKDKENYENAKDYFNKCLSIRIKKLGTDHLFTVETYNSLGQVCFRLKEYKNALKYYEICLNISLKKSTPNHSTIGYLFNSNANCHKKLKKYFLAISYFKKGFEVLKKGGIKFQIAECYELLNKHDKALKYYIECSVIHKNDKYVGLEHEATQEAIANAKRLAKELNKESELPEWMN